MKPMSMTPVTAMTHFLPTEDSVEAHHRRARSARACESAGPGRPAASSPVWSAGLQWSPLSPTRTRELVNRTLRCTAETATNRARSSHARSSELGRGRLRGSRAGSGWRRGPTSGCVSTTSTSTASSRSAEPTNTTASASMSPRHCRTRPSTATTTSASTSTRRVSLATCTLPVRGSTIARTGRHASRTARTRASGRARGRAARSRPRATGRPGRTPRTRRTALPLQRRRSSICSWRSAAWYACVASRHSSNDFASVAGTCASNASALHAVVLGEVVPVEVAATARAASTPRSSGTDCAPNAETKRPEPGHGADRGRDAGERAVAPTEPEVRVVARARAAHDRAGAVGACDRTRGRTVEHLLAPRRHRRVRERACRRVVAERCVVRAPHHDRRVVAEQLDHRARLARGLPAHAARVPALHREVLPEQEPGLVGRVVERRRRDVGVHAEEVEVRVDRAVDVGAEELVVGLAEQRARRRVARALQEHALAVDEQRRIRGGARRGTRHAARDPSLTTPSTSTSRSNVHSGCGPSARGHQRGGSSTVSVHASSFVPVASVTVRHASSSTTPAGPRTTAWRCASAVSVAGVERDVAREPAAFDGRLDAQHTARGRCAPDPTTRAAPVARCRRDSAPDRTPATASSRR